MAAGTCARLRSTLLFVGVFVSVSADQNIITAESGQNVTLPCRTPNNIKGVEWSRKDLGDEYVLFYRDGQFDPDNQHPSFVNRVDLQDRQMKDGDVSLILKNVTTADVGTYECRIIKRGTNRRRRANLESAPISIISLRVVGPPGHRGGATEDEEEEEDGAVGLIVGLSVSAVLLVAAAVGFLIYRKQKQSQDPYQPPDELQPV